MAILDTRKTPNARSSGWATGSKAAILAVIAAAFLCQHSASQPSASESELKAAVVFRFLNYIEWPDEIFEDEFSPVHVGLLGKSSLEEELRTVLKDKTVQGRPLRFTVSTNAAELAECQVVYIGESKREHLADVLKALNIDTTLTVSDLPGFAETGGMIHLFRAENKIRFNVNMGIIKKSKIKISSRLLQLASSILEDKEDEEDPSSQI